MQNTVFDHNFGYRADGYKITQQLADILVRHFGCPESDDPYYRFSVDILVRDSSPIRLASGSGNHVTFCCPSGTTVIDLLLAFQRETRDDLIMREKILDQHEEEQSRRTWRQRRDNQILGGTYGFSWCKSQAAYDRIMQADVARVIEQEVVL